MSIFLQAVTWMNL